VGQCSDAWGVLKAVHAKISEEMHFRISFRERCRGNCFSVRPDHEPGKRSARPIIPLVGDWEFGFLWILELEIWNFCPATLIFREWRSAPEASTLTETSQSDRATTKWIARAHCFL
jgi:hypothetical protein